MGLVILLTGNISIGIAKTGPITVRGQVLDPMGIPVKLACIYLTDISETYYHPLQSIQSGTGGKFTLVIKEPGAYKLWIGAVNYEIAAVPLFLSETESRISFKISLRPNRYQLSAGVKISGSWNDFDPAGDGIMRRQSDGTFVYEVNTGKYKLIYQLTDIATGQNMGGTMADAYEYNGIRMGGF